MKKVKSVNNILITLSIKFKRKKIYKTVRKFPVHPKPKIVKDLQTFAGLTILILCQLTFVNEPFFKANTWRSPYIQEKRTQRRGVQKVLQQYSLQQNPGNTHQIMFTFLTMTNRGFFNLDVLNKLKCCCLVLHMAIYSRIQHIQLRYTDATRHPNVQQYPGALLRLAVRK